ncbi:MAG: NAD(P)H-dependent oxidoreductase [Nanoarchaeota archaeon]
MKRNIVVIDGSYRTNGTTAALIKNIISGIRKKNPDIGADIISLRNHEILFCAGCNLCTQDQKSPIAQCSLGDEMKSYMAMITRADVVVIATPIYEYAPTAIMKRFMERCLPLFKFSGMGPKPRTPLRKDTHGVILLPSGAPFPINELFGMTRYPKRMLRFLLRGAGCKSIHTLCAGGMVLDTKLHRKYEKKAYKMGCRIGARFVRDLQP